MAACNTKLAASCRRKRAPQRFESSSSSPSSRCSCNHPQVSPDKVSHFRQKMRMISLSAFSVFKSVARYYFSVDSSNILFLGLVSIALFL
mmetsp:Transcript_6602/g.13896  ORF Transcript_6602/g.13896 Transcript_6602/m.13896 type:complete len:90 (-) Transcript_6602:101-370(-)